MHLGKESDLDPVGPVFRVLDLFCRSGIPGNGLWRVGDHVARVAAEDFHPVCGDKEGWSSRAWVGVSKVRYGRTGYSDRTLVRSVQGRCGSCQRDQRDQRED